MRYKCPVDDRAEFKRATNRVTNTSKQIIHVKDNMYTIHLKRINANDIKLLPGVIYLCIFLLFTDLDNLETVLSKLYNKGEAYFT